MTKRILAVILLASMLALVKPAPAVAHPNVFFPILPFFGAVISIPRQILGSLAYGPPGYGPSAYGPPPCAPRAVYGPRGFYGPRQVFARPYRGYRSGAYYRPRVVARRFRRW
jgi:hypothetical protein